MENIEGNSWRNSSLKKLRMRLYNDGLSLRDRDALVGHVAENFHEGMSERDYVKQLEESKRSGAIHSSHHDTFDTAMRAHLKL